MGETLGIAHNVFEKMEREKDRKERLKKYEEWQKEKIKKKQKLREMRARLREAERSGKDVPSTVIVGEVGKKIPADDSIDDIDDIGDLDEELENDLDDEEVIEDKVTQLDIALAINSNEHTRSAKLASPEDGLDLNLEKEASNSGKKTKQRSSALSNTCGKCSLQ